MNLLRLQQDLKNFRQQQKQNFLNQNPTEIFKIQSTQTDQIIKRLALDFKLTSPHCHLFAIGGYGQEELYPHSDLDLLFIYDATLDISTLPISQFVCALWDLGFTPKLITHDIASCIHHLKNDLFFYTSALSLRLLNGSTSVYSRLRQKIYSEEIWFVDKFITARLGQRQQELEKYKKFTAPIIYNIKLHPGGLRDFHLLRWLLQKTNATSDCEIGVKKNYIDAEGSSKLQDNLKLLQTLRCQLHLLQSPATDLLSYDFIEKNLTSLNLLFERTDPEKNAHQIMMQFHQITAENFELIGQISRQLARDFACRPETH